MKMPDTSVSDFIVCVETLVYAGKKLPKLRKLCQAAIEVNILFCLFLKIYLSI